MANEPEDMNGLIAKIQEWREKYEDGRELHKFLSLNISGFNDLEKAAAFFIFNRITFSGTTESGGYSELSFRGRFTESSIARFKKIETVVKNSKISNLDFQEVIEAEGEHVFIFLDPPYHSATKSALYGKNGNLHKGFDHVRFAETMKRCKHKWLITYDDSPYIRLLFSFASIIPWDLTYGMRNVTDHSDQKGKELFISNYLHELPMETARESQLTFFDTPHLTPHSLH